MQFMVFDSRCNIFLFYKINKYICTECFTNKRKELQGEVASENYENSVYIRGSGNAPLAS